MFINTLPIIFSFTTLFTAIEAGILLLSIFLLVTLITPQCEKSWQENHSQTLYLYLHSAWSGQTALWRAFWPFLLLINIIFYYIDYRIMSISFTIDSWKTVHLMLILPTLWWITSVWRCSAKSQHKIYSSAARTISIYLLIEFILRYVISTEYPQALFDCRLITIEYGDC